MSGPSGTYRSMLGCFYLIVSNIKPTITLLELLQRILVHNRSGAVILLQLTDPVLSLYLPVCCLFIHPSTHPSIVHPSICSPIHLSIHLLIHPSFCLLIDPECPSNPFAHSHVCAIHATWSLRPSIIVLLLL